MSILIFLLILSLNSILTSNDILDSTFASDDTLDSIISSDNLFKCEELIKHCIECDPEENSYICTRCEDKYFWLPDNKTCIPCNDPLYGQIGCEGKCDGSNYGKSRIIFCETGGCQEGYYNLNGSCIKCNISSPGCSKCIYEVREDKYEGNVICNECENNEYNLTEFGNCEHCSFPNCEKCHYTDNYTKQECDKCVENYYIAKDEKCKQCYWVYISNYDGRCQVCSDNETDYINDSCWCYDGYSLIEGPKCLKCPDKCHECLYNNTINDTICLRCYNSYTLNENKKCIYCGNECRYCVYNKKDKEIECLSCNSGLPLYNGKCLESLNGCSQHILNKSSEYKNESLCKECDSSYALNPEKKCTNCRYNNPDTGYNCDRCFFNGVSEKYECLECSNSYYASYISNKLQCLEIEGNEAYLYGCKKANYNEITNKYECLECNYDFALIMNDKVCEYKYKIRLSSYCLEYENLGTIEKPLYSCNKCENNMILTTINSTINQKDCYIKSDNLLYCLEGIINEEGNYICTQCANHSSINIYNICECNNGFFGKYNGLCYSCDDKKVGNPGCLAEKGCNYYYLDNQLYCNECKEGYINYTRGQCYSCFNIIPNCEKCHFDNTEGEVKCDSCSNYFYLDKKNNKCELIECEEYLEISPGCIICNDKLEEYKPLNKCQICKYGYFKTKEETCVYCRDEKYGGPACYECGYKEDNIICKECFSINKYYKEYNEDDNCNSYYNNDFYKYIKDNYDSSFLSSNGKCYYGLEDDLPENCFKYEIIKDKNITKMVCKVCILGYYLDSNGKCINFIDKIEKLQNCRYQYYIIDQFRMSLYVGNQNEIKNRYYLSIKEHSDNFNNFNEYIKSVNFSIETVCGSAGYFINDEGQNEILDINQCTGRFIIQNIERRMDNCIDLCNEKDYPFIYIKLKDNLIDYDYENYNYANDIDNLTIAYNLLNDFNIIADYETEMFILNNTICYIPSNDSPNSKLKNCKKILYIPKTNILKCIECKSGYILDNTTNICKIYYYEYEY